MVFNKKISSDILLLVLLVVRLRLDTEVSLFERYNRVPESREVYLGSSSAYTQITFHAPYSNNRHAHPKNWEFYEQDDATILFNRLNYINSVRGRRNNLIAYYASSPGVQNMESNIESTNVEATGGDDASGSASLPTVAADSGCNNSGGTGCERDTSSTTIHQDLSPEDMDLIEILWKQDIDMGVTRDAYDSRSGLEVEKLKDVEYTKETQNYMQELFVHDVKSEDDSIPAPLAGLNYTVDSETGEFVLDGISQLKEEIPSDQLLENDTLALTQDSYLPFYEDAGSIPSLADAFPDDDLPDLLSDNYTDSVLLSHLEDFEKQLESFVPLDEQNETLNYPQPPDVFSNIEDCFLDASTLLPFSTNHQPQFVPLSPRQEISYTNTASVSILSAVPTTSSEAYTEILHNPALEVATTEEPYHNIAVSVGANAVAGTTSVGCALAESIATLHNDSDPIPSSSFINTEYNPDPPELMCSNASLSTAQNEFLNNLFHDDTFQLMPLSAEGNQNITSEDPADISSDSASLASGQVPSVSNCDWGDSCSESSSHNGEMQSLSFTMSAGRGGNGFNQNAEFYHSTLPTKRQKHPENNDVRNRDYSGGGSYEHINDNGHYSPIKNEYTDIYEDHANGFSNSHGHRKFDYNHRSGAVSTSLLHHNHSYHLPIVKDESRYKPVLRDKSRSSEDEHCNKDEKRAKELKLPISIDDIINLAIDEYNERLSKYELTDQQLTLIRDIRRRGKNKVAAQNCRKRKMNQITSLQDDLSVLQKQKMQLKSKKSDLLKEKRYIEDKYAKMCQIISQYTNCVPPGPSSNLPIHSNTEMTLSTTTDITMSGDESDFSRGARTKRKMRK